MLQTPVLSEVKVRSNVYNNKQNCVSRDTSLKYGQSVGNLTTFQHLVGCFTPAELWFKFETEIMLIPFCNHLTFPGSNDKRGRFLSGRVGEFAK